MSGGLNIQRITPAAASTTETGKIVEDTNTATPKVLEITAHADANAWGAWTELDASLSVDSWLCSVTIFVPFDAGQQVLEVGKGGSGSEVTIARWSFKLVYLTAVGMMASLVFTLPIPIKIASGTRLALRIADSIGGENDYMVSAQYYQGLET